MGVKGVKICREGLSRAEALMLEGGLREMVRALIADYNRKIGDAVLYYTECLGFWVLFGKREDGSDRRIASGYASVESLAALVERLQKGTFASAAGGRESEQKGVAGVAECEGGIPTDVRCGNGNRRTAGDQWSPLR